MNLPVPTTPGPLVVRSAVSPIAVGATIGGAVLALVTGGGVLGIIVLALLGWVTGTAGTVAYRRRTSGVVIRDRIDPFALGEPWRFFVRDALTARNRFEDTLRSTKPGPVKDRLVTIQDSVEAGVRECWEVAKQAQTIAQARKQLDAPALRRRLETLEGRDVDTTVTERSVRAQLDSVARLDAVLADVTSRLEVLEAQLTEAVTRAIEVSALARHDDELAGVGTAIEHVVDNLEALRAALDETNRTASPELPPHELPPPDR